MSEVPLSIRLGSAAVDASSGRPAVSTGAPRAGSTLWNLRPLDSWCDPTVALVKQN